MIYLPAANIVEENVGDVFKLFFFHCAWADKPVFDFVETDATLLCSCPPRIHTQDKSDAKR